MDTCKKIIYNKITQKKFRFTEGHTDENVNYEEEFDKHTDQATLQISSYILGLLCKKYYTHHSYVEFL